MSEPTSDRPLLGRTIAVTAERRSSEQAELFRSRGAVVVYAPTMHTLDLDDDAQLKQLTLDLVDAPPDWTVATTGYGMRLWFDAAERWGSGDALLDALRTSRVVARGPKARSACRQRGLEVIWSAPQESMPEVVAWLADQPDVSNQSLAVQLFDPQGHPTTSELRSIAGDVTEVPIYRWRHPDDRAPAFELIEQITEGRLDAVTFTSQPAVRFLFEMAHEVGRAEHLVEAFNDGRALPVCIGPVNAEALVEAGVTTSVWPEPNRLVAMVKLATDRLAGS